MQIIHISKGGPERIIEIGGKDYHFEMHSHLGPMPINPKTKSENKIGDKHFFWHAVSIWAQKGEKFKPDGKCEWNVDIEEYCQDMGLAAPTREGGK